MTFVCWCMSAVYLFHIFLVKFFFFSSFDFCFLLLVRSLVSVFMLFSNEYIGMVCGEDAAVTAQHLNFHKMIFRRFNTTPRYMTFGILILFRHLHISLYILHYSNNNIIYFWILHAIFNLFLEIVLGILFTLSQ